MAAAAVSTRTCLGVACQNLAGTLQCPTCLKLGVESFFCSQDCFKNSWIQRRPLTLTRNLLAHSSKSKPSHKAVHKTAKTGTYDPFPDFKYSGTLKAVYPLSPPRVVPSHIKRPDYAGDGIPRSEIRLPNNPKVLSEEEIVGMRKVCRLAREVLDIAAAMVKPGITTDMIDEVVHRECLKRDSYPSPLNYSHFPKSVCTSVNECICHGIPDQRVLQDGDILNIDVTLYHGGFHGDLNETYYVGDKARNDPDTVRVVETARECLNKAIAIVEPEMRLRSPGSVIEEHAASRNCSVVRTYCGHGINTLFHCAPNIPHYAKNRASGTAKPGMCFTIEPMINLGSHKDKTWPDNWTSTTIDGKKSAQFEHTLLVTEKGCEVLTARLPSSPGGPIPMPMVGEAGETKESSTPSTEAPVSAFGGMSGLACKTEVVAEPEGSEEKLLKS